MGLAVNTRDNTTDRQAHRLTMEPDASHCDGHDWLLS